MRVTELTLGSFPGLQLSGLGYKWRDGDDSIPSSRLQAPTLAEHAASCPNLQTLLLREDCCPLTYLLVLLVVVGLIVARQGRWRRGLSVALAVTAVAPVVVVGSVTTLVVAGWRVVGLAIALLQGHRWSRLLHSQISDSLSHKRKV